MAVIGEVVRPAGLVVIVVEDAVRPAGLVVIVVIGEAVQPVVHECGGIGMLLAAGGGAAYEVPSASRRGLTLTISDLDGYGERLLVVIDRLGVLSEREVVVAEAAQTLALVPPVDDDAGGGEQRQRPSGRSPTGPGGVAVHRRRRIKTKTRVEAFVANLRALPVQLYCGVVGSRE